MLPVLSALRSLTLRAAFAALHAQLSDLPSGGAGE